MSARRSFRTVSSAAARASRAVSAPVSAAPTASIPAWNAAPTLVACAAVNTMGGALTAYEALAARNAPSVPTSASRSGMTLGTAVELFVQPADAQFWL